MAGDARSRGTAPPDAPLAGASVDERFWQAAEKRSLKWEVSTQKSEGRMFLANAGLMTAEFVLAGYQMTGYFTAAR
jgi:hypothetical protein